MTSGIDLRQFEPEIKPKFGEVDSVEEAKKWFKENHDVIRENSQKMANSIQTNTPRKKE